MRKNSIAIISLAFLASCFMVSCSTEAFDTNQPVKGAKIVIPAQKMSTKAVDAAGKATFKTSEVVYICKGTTIDEGELQPAKNGPSADITGTLQNAYSVGDEITVLYNTNARGVVDYSGQDGSIGSVKDAGYADNVEIVSYSGNVLTTTSATIENLQSIFKFTFYNGSIDEANKISGIRFVRVFSTNNKLVSSYNAISKISTPGPVTISRSTNLDDNYIYAALRFNPNDGDEIVFQVIDENGKVYSGSKSAPDGGFKIGKFYESTVTVNLYTFTVSSGKQVCFSPGDLGVDNGVYSFTEPFARWGGEGATDAATRVYFEGNEARPDKELYGVTWRLQTWPNPTNNKNEWENLIARSMNEGVNPYYKVQVGSNKYCVLLPPDETIASDIGDDLTSSVTDYIKYIAKGFVILMNTNYKDSNNKWGNTDMRKQGGYYWTNRPASPADRTLFYWTNSTSPTTTNASSAYHCLHVRYVHDL